MPSKTKLPQIPLPKSWSTRVKSAILQIIALARYALARISHHPASARPPDLS